MAKGVTLNTGLRVKGGLIVITVPIKISPHAGAGETISKAGYIRAIANSWAAAVKLLSPMLDPSWGEGHSGLNLVVRCGPSESDARIGLKTAMRALRPPSAAAVRSEIATMGGHVCASCVYEARQAADAACGSPSVRILSRFKAKAGQSERFTTTLEKSIGWKEITAEKPSSKCTQEVMEQLWDEKKIANPLAQACAILAATKLSPSTVSTRSGLLSPLPLKLNKEKVMSLLASMMRASKTASKVDMVVFMLYRTGVLGASQTPPDASELAAAIREAASALAK